MNARHILKCLNCESYFTRKEGLLLHIKKYHWTKELTRNFIQMKEGFAKKQKKDANIMGSQSCRRVGDDRNINMVEMRRSRSSEIQGMIRVRENIA